MAEAGAFERPDRKVLLVWRLSSAFSYLLLALIAVPLAFVLRATTGSIGFLLIPLGLGGLWLLTAFILRKQWECWTFRLTDVDLEISRGWVWRQTRAVARDRVQHLDINSGPLDRRFGLVQVVVYTAGATVGFIPGLRPERAAQLRDELMQGRGVL